MLALARFHNHLSIESKSLFAQLLAKTHSYHYYCILKYHGFESSSLLNRAIGVSNDIAKTVMTSTRKSNRKHYVARLQSLFNGRRK